jgi:hypothetical protein
MAVLKASLEAFGKAFAEAFDKACAKPSPNQEQEQDQEQEQKIRARAEAQRADAHAAEPWIPAEPWKGFCEMRTKARKPLTARSTELIVKKLELLRSQGEDPGEILDQSTRNCWQDVFPLKDKGHRKNGSNGQANGTDQNIAAVMAGNTV